MSMARLRTKHTVSVNSLHTLSALDLQHLHQRATLFDRQSLDGPDDADPRSTGAGTTLVLRQP